ncbi:MAG: hypothetical protein AAFY64_02740 [Pseudomonadota bacterium]
MDPTALIGLATGGVGGLLGGNILGAMTKAGAGTNSLVGMVGGAAATYFLGPQVGGIIGPMLGAGAGMGATDIGGIVSNLAAGAGGGGILSIVIGVLKSMFSR